VIKMPGKSAAVSGERRTPDLLWATKPPESPASRSRAGIATHLIRQQTGHASEATMSRYIREGSLFRGNAAGQLL
jgi:hypothetical protein